MIAAGGELAPVLEVLGADATVRETLAAIVPELALRVAVTCAFDLARRHAGSGDVGKSR